MEHGKIYLFGKKDHRQLNFHCYSYHKIGLLVLFVHDITDIWLELAKALHYMVSRKGGRECPRWELAGNTCFGVFLLCW